MKHRKSQFLSNDGSIIEILKIALPLILSSSCHAVNMFTDRLMLTRYSQASAAAALTSGLTNFTIQCFFIGAVGYAGTFVAQYSGANKPLRVGSAVWQGIFLALLGGLFMIGSYFWSPYLFRALGHSEEVTHQEIVYFQILSIGAVFILVMQALSCFWSGRGKTTMVLAVSILVTCLNLPFNYMLIYGKFGCPELGIAGAAWGTILAAIGGMLIYAIGFFGLKSARRHFGTCSHIWDWSLFKRMVRFGSPNGVQLLLDLSAFNVFIIVLSLYGVTVQEACSIVFGINNLAFCPILGIGMTASILVGQSVGAHDIPHAKRSVRSARHLMFIYMSIMILLFSVFPQIVLEPFTRVNDPAQQEVMRIARIMLLFIAAYLFGDGLALIYSNAVRGAGDTRYMMWLTIVMAWGAFAIPCIILRIFDFSFWALWYCLSAYVLIFGLLCYRRYRGGKWTTMQVIEPEVIE
ncbi:MAG: MATE family efflux transporter [Victivallaceae bacterium]|nr:MATE family efflux transporter [Victivallaceae bacterium]